MTKLECNVKNCLHNADNCCCKAAIAVDGNKAKTAEQPLLSETARRFNVNNNIISAQMDYAGGVKFGIMLTEMHGTQQDTQAAIAWLQEHHVKVEVLGYV